MASFTRRSLRAAWVLSALGAPWFVYACDLAPLGPAAASSSGSGGAVAGVTASVQSSSGATATAGSSSGATTTGSGGAGTGGGHTGDGGDGGTTADADAGVACDTIEVTFPLLPGLHVPVCSQITTWDSNPPTSGEHYPIWAAYKTYSTPVPRGFYLHDEEHGAVVILYNCPSGCDAELAQLAAWLDARPADPTCTPPVHARIVVTPDPLIPTRFAAAAWGFALTSQCFDLAALGPFIDAHYAMGPENFCTDGVDVTAADAGIPDGCGQGDGG